MEKVNISHNCKECALHMDAPLPTACPNCGTKLPPLMAGMVALYVYPGLNVTEIKAWNRSLTREEVQEEFELTLKQERENYELVKRGYPGVLYR